MGHHSVHADPRTGLVHPARDELDGAPQASTAGHAGHVPPRATAWALNRHLALRIAVFGLALLVVLGPPVVHH